MSEQVESKQPLTCQGNNCEECRAQGLQVCYSLVRTGQVVAEMDNGTAVIWAAAPCASCAVLPANGNDRLCADCRTTITRG